MRLDRPESVSEVDAKCRRALSVRGLNCGVFCSPLASFVSGCQASIGRFGAAVDIKQIVHELSANASDSELPSASHQMAAALGNYLMSTEAEMRLAGVDEAIVLDAFNREYPCGVDQSVLEHGAASLHGSRLSLLTNTDRASLCLAAPC